MRLLLDCLGLAVSEPEIVLEPILMSRHLVEAKKANIRKRSSRDGPNVKKQLKEQLKADDGESEQLAAIPAVDMHIDMKGYQWRKCLRPPFRVIFVIFHELFDIVAL